MKSLKQELQDRSLLYQFTDEKLFELFDKWGQTFYLGFDPTADSLHLGNFIGFIVAIHLMRRWNHYIAMTWWATGMIWDPGWKDAERNFLSPEILDNNQKKIAVQISQILEKLKNFTGDNFSYSFANNKDFYENMLFLDFLRDVWKFMTINVMMAKDTVKRRIEDPDKSISYTEFSYQLIQGYDFVRFFEDKWVKLQIWWQDQWWNLVTGVELIRKKYNEEAFALSWPLITDSSWKKFGKSEWNAMFLNKDKTSPYFIYQYFMNTSDEDVGKYMKMLTLLETEEIDEIVANHLKSPEKREWQKLLAFKVVEIVHWTKDAELCEKITNFIFWDNCDSGFCRLDTLKSLGDEELKIFQKAMWWFDYKWENLFETIVKSGLANSNSEAREAVKSGAIFIHWQQITDFNFDVSKHFINDKFLLLRKGKKSFRIIRK